MEVSFIGSEYGMIKSRIGGRMSDPNSIWSPIRDAFDIIVAALIAGLTAFMSWLGRRLMKHIDNKVDIVMFEQHQQAVMAKFDETEKRHNDDRVDLKDGMKEVNRKLDRVMDYLMQDRGGK